MSNRMIAAAGKVLASLVVAPLLGAAAGGAYALVIGGVHWIMRGEGDRVLIFAGQCVGGGAVLGLLVAVCRVGYFAWVMAARPETARQSHPSRIRTALSLSWPAVPSPVLDNYVPEGMGKDQAAAQPNDGISSRGPEGLTVPVSSADKALPPASPPPHYLLLSSPQVFSAESGPALSI
jgi:hypothetical protein